MGIEVSCAWWKQQGRRRFLSPPFPGIQAETLSLTAHTLPPQPVLKSRVPRPPFAEACPPRHPWRSSHLPPEGLSSTRRCFSSRISWPGALAGMDIQRERACPDRAVSQHPRRAASAGGCRWGYSARCAPKDVVIQQWMLLNEANWRVLATFLSGMSRAAVGFHPTISTVATFFFPS
jgi:hypothetical protein